MMYKKIALCCLFFSGHALCMLGKPVKKIDPKKTVSFRKTWNDQFFTQKSIPKVLPRIMSYLDSKSNDQVFTQKLVPDAWPIIMNHLDFNSNDQLTLIQKPISDVLPIIMNHLDFNSNVYFLKTCKYLHQTYKDKGFVLSPEAYMQEMIRASRAGDRERVGLLIKRESAVHKKQRESILQCFNADYSDLNAVMDYDLDAVMDYDLDAVMDYDLDKVMEVYKREYDSKCEDFSNLKMNFRFGGLAENQLFCRLLLKQGFSPNKEDKESNTLLSLAIEYNDLETIKLLLGHEEIDPNKETEQMMYRETPLMVAINRGNSEAIKLLLGHENINPNKETKNMMCRGTKTPLMVAINRGNSEAIKLLLEHEKINPNTKCGTDMDTPLMIAVYERNLEAIKLLLGHEDIDPNKETGLHSPMAPIYVAINMRDSETIKYLLENEKIDPNKEFNDGETPLFYVARNLASKGKKQASKVKKPASKVKKRASKVEILGILLDHSKINMKNLFWYDFHYYVSCNPDFSKLLSKCTYKARCLYWCGYIVGYMRRVIDNRAAIYSDGYVGDIVLNVSFLSILLSLAYLSNCLKSLICQ